MWYCGIDPGLSGAMAFYRNDILGENLFVHSFVTVKSGSTSNSYHKANHRKEIDIVETASIIRKHIEINGPVKLVYLETPHSLPNDGHVGAFRFGKVCGIIEGVLGALGLKVVPAMPTVWKKKMNLSSSKEQSLRVARETFKNIPHANKHFELRKDHDKAEAALMAFYAHSIFSPPLKAL